MEALSKHFDEMIICCPFVQYDESKIVTTYQNPKISFIELPNVGGDTLKDKIKLVTILPTWLKAFYKLHKRVDIVYQRFPNNLNIPGFFFFYFLRKKVFATYTGTWAYENNQPLSYRFQKWLLKNFFRGPVWVYTTQEKIGKNIYGGFSPSYTLQEWNEETEQVAQRVTQLQIGKPEKLKMVSVGTLNDNKNQIYLLQTCLLLRNENIPYTLTLVGEGPLKSKLQQFVVDNQLQGNVAITGSLNYQQLRKVYRENDFVVQAAISEGFGKVPIEGFFHGLLPILNESALAPYMTGNGSRGFLFNAKDATSLVNVLQHVYYTTSAKLLVDMIEQGRIFAQTQTLENWAEIYYKKISE